jgi:putative oxidoreductase
MQGGRWRFSLLLLFFVSWGSIKTNIIMKALIPSRIAEIIFAVLIGYAGIAWHFMNADGLAGAIPDFLPGDPKIWVYITGAGFVLAAIAIITGILKTLACYLLAAMLLVFVFTIHLKNFESNPSGLVKDLAMAMCAILIGNRSNGN